MGCILDRSLEQPTVKFCDRTSFGSLRCGGSNNGGLGPTVVERGPEIVIGRTISKTKVCTGHVR